MRKLIIITALVLSLSSQAQYYYPHPTKFTQTQIDMMPDSYLRGLRKAYPDYIIRRSNVGWEEPQKKLTAKQQKAVDEADNKRRIKELEEEEHEERPMWYWDLTPSDKKKFDAGNYEDMEYGKEQREAKKLKEEANEIKEN